MRLGAASIRERRLLATQILKNNPRAVYTTCKTIVFISQFKLETKLYIARLQSRATFGVSQRFTDIEEAVGESEENEIVLYVDYQDSAYSISIIY